MARTPKIQIHAGSLEGERKAEFELPPDDRKAQLNSNISVSLIEKLRAMAFHEDTPMNTILERALMREIREAEDRRGEPYKVLETHRVRSRK